MAFFEYVLFAILLCFLYYMIVQFSTRYGFHMSPAFSFLHGYKYGSSSREEHLKLIQKEMHDSDTVRDVSQEKIKNHRQSFFFESTLQQLKVLKTNTKQAEELLLTMNLGTLICSGAKAKEFASFLCDICFESYDILCLVEIIVCLAPYANHHVVAKAIVKVYQSTDSSSCTQLKLKVDQKFSLHKLVFHTIESSVYRQKLLSHFELASSDLESQDGLRPVQLLSDIDDTLYSFLFDKRYPATTVYPGVRKFHQELCTLGYEEAPRKTVFLTARPEMLRQHTLNDIRLCGIPHFTVLMGTFASLFSKKRMWGKKLQNFEEYRLLFPELRFIYIGDNGQSDIDLSKLLKGHTSVCSVLIHNIFEQKKNRVYRSQECKQYGMNMFNSYVGASLHVYREGYLNLDAMVRIVEATLEDFQNIQFNSKQQQDDASTSILKDITEVVQLLPSSNKYQMMNRANKALFGSNKSFQDKAHQGKQLLVY